MITWSRPEWLAALAVVPIAIGVVIWSLQRRSRALDRFSEADVRSRTQSLTGRRRSIRGGLIVVSFTALALALAGPQWGVERVEALPVGQEVVFALDISRSMLTSDVSPTRLDRAKLAVRQMLATLPTAEAGLVVFAGEAALVVPLTRDASAIDLYLSSVDPTWVSDPSTDLSRAVATALDAFSPAPSPGRAVVVLTDGEDHGGGVASVAAAAGRRGIEVYPVAIGSEEGGRVPDGLGGWVSENGKAVISRLELEALDQLADASGGERATVGPAGEDLGRVVGRLQGLDTGRTEGRDTERRGDRYRWPLLVALLAFGAEAVLAYGRRLRPRRVLALLAALGVVGMGRSSSPEQAYEEGRYAEALIALRHADRAADAGPEDAFNRGNAAYRSAEFYESSGSHAVAARTVGDRPRAAEAWYNAGNGRFRIAEEVESRDPDDSLRYWDSTVAAYREALLRAPSDADAKHNLELALQRREEALGGGGGGGSNGGAGGAGGGPGGGGSGVQPPSTGGNAAPDAMTRSEAERLLDALAAEEREALTRGEGGERARRSDRPGW